MNVKEELLQEFDTLKGQFVLTHFEGVFRLIGLGEDYHDYFWIGYNGRKLICPSPLQPIIPLKGFISDKYYVEFLRLAELNHSDLVGNFNLEEWVIENLKGDTILALYTDLK